jgi:MarR family transcriptional regulator, organic hydroperoxide resistance regulator
MSTEDRSKTIAQLFEAVQEAGNIGVLHTNAIAQKIGLSAAEFECMDAARLYGPLTAGELARRCGITTGGMTGMLDRLERGGFVERMPDPQDRRRVVVRSRLGDPENKQLLARLHEFYKPMEEGFYEGLSQFSDAELKAILSFYIGTVRLARAATEQLADK